MAKEFTLTTADYKGRYLKLVCKQTPNVAGNYSDISWTLTAAGGSSNYYSTGPTEVWIAGTKVYDKKRTAWDSKTFPAAKGSVDGTIRVYHKDNDGTCTAVVSLKTAIYVAEVSTVSGSWVLDPIARASEVSAADANIESAATVVVSRKNNAFTHSVAYAFGSLQGYLDSTGKPVDAEEKFTETTLNFLLPESFYSQIPNAPSDTVELTCRTYSGNSLIGTKTCRFTATAAQSRCAPSLEAWVEDVNSASLALTGDKTKLIRFVSTARCYVTATAQKGATITQRLTDGGEVTGAYFDYPETERAEYHTYAKDSRGYQAWYNESCQLIPYVILTGNASIVRTDPTSGNARLTVTGNCYRGSFGAVENTLQVCCRYGGQEQVLETQWNEDHSYTVDALISGLDYTQTCPVEITVTDAVTSVTKTVTVKPGIPVFDWGEKDFAFHVPVTAPQILAPVKGTVNGITMAGARVWQETGFSFRSKYSQWDSGGNRQSVFLFGNRNGTPVWGVIGISSDGSAIWSGTEGITVTAGYAGEITVELGSTVYDYFTLLSAEPFYIE